MKRIVLSLLLCSVALLSLAQKKLYYCEVKGIEKELTSGLKIVLTSSLRHPKILIKEFCSFLMPCHQHGLRINLLV